LRACLSATLSPSSRAWFAARASLLSRSNARRHATLSSVKLFVLHACFPSRSHSSSPKFLT
jgi:hypothetical protein